jgi:hypothetical protein
MPPDSFRASSVAAAVDAAMQAPRAITQALTQLTRIRISAPFRNREYCSGIIETNAAYTCGLVGQMIYPLFSVV